MPGSQHDRPTNSYEHVLLFSKRPRYFWDEAAIAEPASMKPQRRLTPEKSRMNGHAIQAWKEPRLLREEVTTDTRDGMRTARDVWDIKADQVDVNADFFRLRSDLSAVDRAYVLSELLKRGCVGNIDDNSSAESQ